LARIRKLGEVGNGDGALKLAKANLEPKGSLGGLHPEKHASHQGCWKASNQGFMTSAPSRPPRDHFADLGGV
jgi:hypothetical protein